LIAVRESRVVGMVSAHDQPPFSVTDRLQDPAVLTRPGTRPLEVRLLAIEPDERNTAIVMGLLYTVYEYARANDYTHLFISGVETRLDLYRRLGFVALGPGVPSGKMTFVPMALQVDQLPLKMQRFKKLWETHLGRTRTRSAPAPTEPVCLLPGPVTTSPAVQKAFHQPPIYHRGPEFIQRFMAVRQMLADITGAKQVAILNGSGTLGNEAVAATLAAEQRHGPAGPGGARGVMLINGEFGERLARQATRFGLNPRVLAWRWGEAWDVDRIDAALAEEPEGSWVWGVHQESSTGVLNDLPGVVGVARKWGMRVCVDCISSLGAVPLDLRDVYLATGATGKSLGSYAGAALIFADAEALRRIDRRHVPSYFDVAAALESEGPCYTFPSPTLMALEAALQEYATPERAQATFARYNELGVYVRSQLRKLDLEPLAADECACPVVTTFAPPGRESSVAFVSRCRSWGYAIGGESAYLAQRRLVQIATMGAITREKFEGLFDHLETWLAQRVAPVLAGVD
jgi:aspartate aminotransferase-like enzyme